MAETPDNGGDKEFDVEPFDLPSDILNAVTKDAKLHDDKVVYSHSNTLGPTCAHQEIGTCTCDPQAPLDAPTEGFSCY